ncbi:hypothetical protein BIS06_14005 [Halomonas sp. BBD48]|nr:hypothetical protein [Halomonas sp. BBD48]
MDCPHILRIQGVVEHGPAAIHVVAQQMREPFGIGGASRPTQQGDLLRYG